MAPAHRCGVRTSRSRTAGSPRSGRLGTATARETIAPPASIVAPGFIDVHTHADDLADHPRAENFVRMGVTSIVAGNCGSSALDVGEALAGIARPARRSTSRRSSATTPCASAVMGTADRAPTHPRAGEDAVAGLAGDDRRRGRVLDRPPVRARHLRRSTPEIIELARVGGAMPAACTPRTCATRAPRSKRPSPKRFASARRPVPRADLAPEGGQPEPLGRERPGARPHQRGARARR